MVTIRTTWPEIPAGLSKATKRRDRALFLSRYLPGSQAGYPLRDDEDTPYTLDLMNDWVCFFDEVDDHLVRIQYRDPKYHPRRELLFAQWVVENNLGWSIVEEAGL